MKIAFTGAGSNSFVKNVIGDVMRTPALWDSEIALYDIDPERLEESRLLLEAMNGMFNENRAKIKTYCGVENRKDALRGARFVINAISVGRYDPCTITDFEVPKKYGLRQTIADTVGIGGIMRALRTIPVLEGFARDMEEVCPDTLFLNYTNPMAMLTGFMGRYTGVNTLGLCHSVQICTLHLMKALHLDDKLEGRSEKIAGINHMAWLLEVHDKDGNDLYPEIRRLAMEKHNSRKHGDMVRYEYIKRLGYYCTESSEHNAEYNPFFIKSRYPELIEAYNIPLDEYMRRCEGAIKGWKAQQENLRKPETLNHQRSIEYASYIMEAVMTGKPYKMNGNVINRGLIENLDADACVEVPCLVDGSGVNPCRVGRLPIQLAAMNMSNIAPQLLTIEAAVTRKKEYIYQAAMMDPHTGAELSIDDIVKMVDELIERHGSWLPEFH